MKPRPLHQPLILLVLIAGAAQADYINSTVTLGGYALDSKDATNSNDFYQMERVNVSALENGLDLHLAYGYSDFYEKRPNTYQTSNRLALANVGFTPAGIDGLRVEGGRDFMSLIDRPLYYDGAEARYQYQGFVQAELFGGYGVPTVYQSDLVDFNSDKALMGGKLTFTPLSQLLIHLDGLVNGRQDDGTLGGDIQGSLGDQVTVSANSVYRLDSNYFSRAEISVLASVVHRVQYQLRFGYQDEKIDSTRNYDYFVNQAHQYMLTGFVYSWNEKISADADYGVLMYTDTTGQLADFKLNVYGFFVGVSQEFATVTDAFDLTAGYSNTYWSRLRLDVAGDYTRYDLDPVNIGLKALDFSVAPTYFLGHGLEATVEYEYLHNRIYDSDNRFYVGIKESFFRGLSK